jgi:hypothetical protein
VLDLKQEEEAREVTRLAREIEMPTGIEPFDRAWKALSRDRPQVPPERCPLRRKLIKKFIAELN